MILPTDDLVRQNLLQQMQQNQNQQAPNGPGPATAGTTPTPPAPSPVAPPAPPAAAPAPGQYLGQLQGFNADKMGSGHISPKYVFAKHAQNYNVQDPASRDALLSALKADQSGYFKDASWGGSNRDRLVIGGQLDPKYGGINTFDVIKGASRGGEGWQWGPEGGPNNTAGNVPMGGDLMGNIRQAIQGYADTQDPSSVARQFLLQFLQQQGGR